MINNYNQRPNTSNIASYQDEADLMRSRQPIANNLQGNTASGVGGAQKLGVPPQNNQYNS